MYVHMMYVDIWLCTHTEAGTATDTDADRLHT